MIMTTKKPTLLSAHEFTIRCEGQVVEAPYLDKPNYLDEYQLTFCPQTTHDHQRLCEAAERALMKCALENHYTQERIEPEFEDRFGFFYINQLFAPRRNAAFSNYCGREATFTLHFRDSVDHKLYLQADYIDFYDPQNGIPQTDEVVASDDDDLMFWGKSPGMT